MDERSDRINDLQTLNDISQTLNHSADVQSALNASLAKLVELMGLETGWIFLKDPSASDRWGGRGFRLAAHHNLPPALVVTNPDAWDKNCDCQSLCLNNTLTGAYNEVRCSRLSNVMGDRKDLAVHASTPLRSGDRVLGILNVAAPSWSSFTERNLTLLANVGSQMGIAIERARLYDSLQAGRFLEQAALLDLSQQLLSRRDLDDLMDFLVDKVRSLLNADACAVLLTGPDPDYLYFRAATGWLSDPVGDQFRVPADHKTGSGRVMASQQVLLIEDLHDLHEDPIWTSDWLDEEGFRAAAMAPLIADGLSIGALVIDSRDPRKFSDDDVRFLRLMANTAALAIEQARLRQEEIERQHIEEELAVGRQIQMSMLPAEPPSLSGWEFAPYFEAAHQVGGDFYDFFPLPGEPGRWSIVIADVSDKGVPAALFMALSRTTIRNIALRGRPPAEVISWANRFIQEDSQSDMFLTAFYAELNTDTGQLTYANAGHDQPLIRRKASGLFQSLPITSPLLGVIQELHVSVVSVVLEPGDVLILYTDGVTEAVDEEYHEFGSARIEETVASLLSERPEATAREIKEAIAAAVKRFAGSMVQYDDLTMLIIKRVESLNEGNHG